jgi:hypothetical protein
VATCVCSIVKLVCEALERPFYDRRNGVRMSALGQKQTSEQRPINVRFTPKSGHGSARP